MKHFLYRKKVKSVEDGKKDISFPNHFNIGSSNYTELGIQPWEIWERTPSINPWDADIIKRTLRTKQHDKLSPSAARIEDYEKIIHICNERIRQLNKK